MLSTRQSSEVCFRPQGFGASNVTKLLNELNAVQQLVAAREQQEMFPTIEQQHQHQHQHKHQRQQFPRFNSGFDVGSGSGSASGFNQMPLLASLAATI